MEERQENERSQTSNKTPKSRIKRGRASLVDLYREHPHRATAQPTGSVAVSFKSQLHG